MVKTNCLRDLGVRIPSASESDVISVQPSLNAMAAEDRINAVAPPSTIRHAK